MYWILLVCNAHKKATTENIVVTTEDIGTENVQDTQEEDNDGVLVWVKAQNNYFFGEYDNEEDTMDFSHQFCT